MHEGSVSAACVWGDGECACVCVFDDAVASMASGRRSRDHDDGVAAAWRRADAIDASRNRADALAIMKTLPQHLVEVPSFFVQVPVVLLELLP